MQKFTNFSRFFLILFLTSLTIALSWGHFQFPFVGAVENRSITIAAKAIASEPEQMWEKPLCRPQEIECWQERIEWLDRKIPDGQEQENWPAVGQWQREQAEAYNQLGKYPQAIALLCGESAIDEDRKKLPTCTRESAIAHAQIANNGLEIIATWGTLAETYRLNSHYDRAILVLEKATELSQTICTAETSDCSSYRRILFDIAGKTFSDRAQRQEQRARSAHNRGAKDESDEFRTKAEKDRDRALEELAKSEARVENIEARVRVWLEMLRVCENRILAFLEAEQSQTNTLEPPVLTEAIARRGEAIAKIQTVYHQKPQLLPDFLRFQVALHLANLIDPDGSETKAALVTYSPGFSAHLCPTRLLSESRQYLEEARKIARGNKWLQSFALGELGHFEECARHFRQALEYTRGARAMARSFPESRYLWYWQAGRIFEADSSPNEAIYAYRRAIDTLEGLRDGHGRSAGLLAYIRQYSRDWQFDFRDRIEPLFRSYAYLLLEKSKDLPFASEERRITLTLAGNAIEALQLMELEEYFGKECNPSKSRAEITRELVKDNTAIFRFIVLGENTAIIAERSDRPPQLKWVNTETLKTRIQDFREEIKRDDIPLLGSRKKAIRLYDLTIAPLIQDWQPGKIDTLVFIQDEIFNNIPMAALYDGQQYLVEKYAIAIVPGLRLTQPRSRRFNKFRILGFGLSEQAQFNRQPLDLLENIERELLVIKQFSGSQPFFNDDFNRETLKKELDRQTYTILHFATHARFETIADDTFLVLGVKNTETQDNEVLTLTELEKTLTRLNSGEKMPDLLVLSACETGKGDDRLTLGLGGIALRAGIPTTVASLWVVNDAATANLMSEFYANLRSGQGVAHALRKAQIAQIKNNLHPYFWAPFITIGNWL